MWYQESRGHFRVVFTLGFKASSNVNLERLGTLTLSDSIVALSLSLSRNVLTYIHTFIVTPNLGFSVTMSKNIYKLKREKGS